MDIFGIKPIKIKNSALSSAIYGDSPRDNKRSLKESEKQRLYIRAKGRCENCGKKVDYIHKNIGHKKAWSKTGKTTVANSVYLCWECNHDQGTKTWEQFRKQQGKPVEKKQKTNKTKTKKKKSKPKNYLDEINARIAGL